MKGLPETLGCLWTWKRAESGNPRCFTSRNGALRGAPHAPWSPQTATCIPASVIWASGRGQNPRGAGWAGCESAGGAKAFYRLVHTCTRLCVCVGTRAPLEHSQHGCLGAFVLTYLAIPQPPPPNNDILKGLIRSRVGGSGPPPILLPTEQAAPLTPHVPPRLLILEVLLCLSLE